MKLNFITIRVRDLETSVAFYKEMAGLEVLNRLNSGEVEIAFLADGIGDTMIELIRFNNAENVIAKGVVISFLAGDNLVELREKAIEFGYSPSEIVVKGPKPYHFTILDPDEVLIEFCG